MTPDIDNLQNHKPLTQIERIVWHMFYHPEKAWWVAQDFMPPAIATTHPHHVGYEASARLTDLLKKYNQEDQPLVFAVEKQGKFRAVRMKWETFEDSLKRFPELIEIAERTDILRRYAGLVDRVAEYKPKPVATKPKFKSYAHLG